MSDKQMIIGTHNGKFHSDDVFSVALLTTLHPDAEVIRSRDASELAKCDIVLDVGGVYDEATCRFDHHMPGGAGTRPNGIRYSALGLIWKAYGLEFCEGSEELWNRMDARFVSSFDAYDNGHDTFVVTLEDANVIQLQDLFDKYLNPNLSEPSALSDYDIAFGQAVDLAKMILGRVKSRILGEIESEQYFYSQWLNSPDKRYVVLDKFATFGQKIVDMPELLFYVFPDVSGTWQAKAIPRSKDSFEPKLPFPISWAGLEGVELQQVSGVEDARFCHNNLYLIGAKSREGAEKMVRITLERQ